MVMWQETWARRTRMCLHVSSVLSGLLIALLMASGVGARSIELWTDRLDAPTTKWLVEEFLPRFEKETRISVVHQGRAMNAEDLAKIGAGEGPDVIIVWQYRLGSLLRTNSLMSLTPFLNRWRDRNAFFPQLRGYDWDNYALPIDIQPNGIAYDKAAFSRAGLDSEAPPRSWEDLEIAAQKTTLELSGRVVRKGFDTWWWRGDFVATFLKLNGELGVSADWRTACLATDKAVETFEFFSRLYQLNYPRTPTTPSWMRPSGGTPKDFPEGFSAMAFGGPWMVTEAQRTNPRLVPNIGFFLPQRYPSTEPTVIAIARAIAITKSSRDPQAAWEFIQWLMKPDNTAMYHAAMGSVPSRRDLREQFAKVAPQMLGWYDAMRYTTLQQDPIYHLEGVIQKAGSDYYMALWGQTDLRAFLAGLNGRYQEILDSWWRWREEQGG